MIRLVSVSGGKDSTATLLLALERHPPVTVHSPRVQEHELTLDYVRMLNDRVHPVHTIHVDFADWWWRRRDYVRDDRIAEWESLMRVTSKRQDGSFFPAPTADASAELRGSNIRRYVEWSQTQRGGAHARLDQVARAAGSMRQRLRVVRVRACA